MDPSFTAIGAMVILLLAFSARKGKAPTEEARRGRILLLGAMAAFIGISYYLNTYVSTQAGNLWSVVFWVLLAAWGYSLRDRGLVLIGLFFALLYLAVGFGLPLLARRG